MIESNIQYPSGDPIEYIDNLSIYQSLQRHIEKETAKSFSELNDHGNNIKNIITKNEIGFIFFELLWRNRLMNISHHNIKKLIIDRLLKQHNKEIDALIIKYTHDSPKPVSMPDKYQKYIDAHNGENEVSYKTALEEITNCAKKTCWIWYILPGNIGFSHTAKYYILHENEVLDYLDNSMLKDHYIKIVEAIKECLT